MTAKTYYPHNLAKSVLEYINIAGAGTPGAHIIATNAEPYTADDNEYAYAIHCYNEECSFGELKEDGVDVDTTRLDAGGIGYPKDTIITGKFTKVAPSADCVVALFVIKIQ